MANLTYDEVFKKYEEEGYLGVPNQYNKNRENRCRICGWRNWEQVDGCLCSECHYQYEQDLKNNRMVAGKINARSLMSTDWLILRAIAAQVAEGKTPYVTIEDFINLSQAHIKQIRESSRAKTPEQERRDAIFYG